MRIFWNWMWEVNCHLRVIFGLVGMPYYSCSSSYLLCKCLQRQSAYTGVYVCFFADGPESCLFLSRSMRVGKLWMLLEGNRFMFICLESSTLPSFWRSKSCWTSVLKIYFNFMFIYYNNSILSHYKIATMLKLYNLKCGITVGTIGF